MLNIVCCFLLLLAVTGVHSQSADKEVGFVSIDCGYTGDNYTDAATNLLYTSDADYAESGVPLDVSKDYIDSSRFPVKQLSTVRSFPDGARNCYALQDRLKEGAKYLVRAGFLYGNHDGLNSSRIHFHLYLGVNLWTEIQLPNPRFWLSEELLFVADSTSVSVCLVRTSNDAGGTAPFISFLELRPLPDSIYPAVDNSNWLVLYDRFYVGTSPSTDPLLRYPDDPYDRTWYPHFNPAGWSTISTTSEVKIPQNDYFLVPTQVLQTAAVPAGNGTKLSAAWTPVKASDGTPMKYHIFLHFAGVQNSSGGAKVVFNVMLNGNLFTGPCNLEYLKAMHIFTKSAQSLTQYNLSIEKDKTSILPPVLNGLETYWLMNLDGSATDTADVDAIMDVKRRYNVKKNWMGDPCAPQAYAWDGLNCTYAASVSPRIIALNLSSSNLTGEIPASLASLKMLTALDLSNNSLHGEIPDFLGDMTSLKLLNLTGNDLSGSIPSVLLQRSKEGSLTLSFESNSGLCTSDNPCPKKNKWILIFIICLVVAVLVTMGILLIIFYGRKARRRRQHGNISSLPSRYQQFTYSELQTITKNFQDKIGEGGFGNVFRGTLENGYQVAVKIRHQSSSQGLAQLITEVKLLSGIHHKNLVSLRGYCNEKINRDDKERRDHIEENCLALVYEYMSKGNLEEYLRDKELCWRERVQIAVDAAEGLDYLHRSCNPPIVHRDVKTSNILLDDKLHAKLADFGLSRAFHFDKNTSTHAFKPAISGTIGYLDPAHQSSSELTPKSDVYSFGVVLLELITGRPPAERQQESGTITKLTEWARSRIDKRDVAELADSRLKATSGGCSIDSFWKAVDVAVGCIAISSNGRPDMATVLVQLNQALKLEVGDSQTTPTSSGNFVTAIGDD